MLSSFRVDLCDWEPVGLVRSDFGVGILWQGVVSLFSYLSWSLLVYVSIRCLPKCFHFSPIRLGCSARLDWHFSHMFMFRHTCYACWYSLDAVALLDASCYCRVIFGLRQRWARQTCCCLFSNHVVSVLLSIISSLPLSLEGRRSCSGGAFTPSSRSRVLFSLILCEGRGLPSVIEQACGERLCIGGWFQIL